jgi:hypothetical protein
MTTASLHLEREADIRQKNADKTTPEEETELREWIEAVTGEPLAEGTLHEVFKSGVALCKLVNAIQPGTIKKIHPETASATRQNISALENIALFLNACKAIGIKPWDLFLTSDLREGSDMRAVLNTIAAFGGAAQKLPDFKGPAYGIVHNARLGASKSRAKPTPMAAAAEEGPAAEAVDDVAVIDLDSLRARVGRPVAMPADPADIRAIVEQMQASMSLPSAQETGKRSSREEVFKVQLPQMAGVPAPFGVTLVPLRCYERTRSVDVFVTQASCSNFEKLWNFVRDGGVAGGLKIYATGRFSEDGRTITINLVEPAAELPW